MTGFDLPTNFTEDDESLLRRTRARLTPPRKETRPIEPVIPAPSSSEQMADKTLREFSAPSAANIPTRPAGNVGDANFEIKTGLITMCRLAHSVGKPMRTLVLISSNSWRFATRSKRRTASSHSWRTSLRRKRLHSNNWWRQGGKGHTLSNSLRSPQGSNLQGLQRNRLWSLQNRSLRSPRSHRPQQRPRRCGEWNKKHHPCLHLRDRTTLHRAERRRKVPLVGL